MGGLFYRLGQVAGPSIRKGQWFWRSLTGSDKDVMAAEEEVGRDLARAFRREMGVDPDPTALAAVNDLGSHLADRVKNKQRRFEFTVVEAETPNAFALPGGFVFITRPLIALAGDDYHQLAFVLAHEMGHVINQDVMERIVTQTAIRAALRALPGAGVAGSWLKSTAGRLLQSAYSQDRELAADELGARLVRGAGYDAFGGVRLLDRFRSLAGQKVPLGEYFSSHPPLEIRIAHINRFLAAR